MRSILLLVLLSGSLLGVGANRQNTERPQSTNNKKASLEIQATVVGVIDGDTIDVRIKGDTKNTRIRIYGIDAAETDKRQLSIKNPKQKQKHLDWGDKAKDFLTELLPVDTPILLMGDVYPRKVQTEFDTDRYERSLAFVIVDGQDVGELLVANGLAWVYSDNYGSSWTTKRTPHYLEVERTAKKNKQGWHKRGMPLKRDNTK